MTLEQLNTRQQELNEQLESILNRLESTVSKITGEYRDLSPDAKEQTYPDNGIICSMEVKQHYNYYLLNKVDESLIRLNNYTYEPAPLDLTYPQKQ